MHQMQLHLKGDKMTEKHKFVALGHTLVCGKCYRPKLHELHLDDLDSTDIKIVEMPDTNREVSKAKQIGELVVMTPKEDPQGIKDKNDPNYPDDSNKPNCYGHICPGCGRFFTHDYKCWPDPKIKNSMWCGQCAATNEFKQAVADGHRHDDIGALEQYVGMHCLISDPKDLKAAEIEHESFCANEIRTNPDFNFEKHIKDLQLKIEVFNAQISGTARAKANWQLEEAKKLTPEELEQFTKNASRSKVKKSSGAASDAVASEKKAKKEYQDLLKDLLKLTKNEKKAKEELDEMYRSEGKEIPA